MSTPALSIVLPAYNESPGLEGLLRDYWFAGQGQDFELILVDNGSTDDTAVVLDRLLAKEQFSFCRRVRVDVNQGYGFGILSGLKEARGTYLAWSHADTQCDPKDVFTAFKRLGECGDKTLVKGRRQKRPFCEELTTHGMRWFALFILDGRLVDINAQPKVFHRDLLAKLVNPPKDLSFDLYVLYRALQEGWKIETVPVYFGERLHGSSSWSSSFLSRWRTILSAICYMIRLRFEG